MAEGSFVRISSLLWADILVGYAFFVMQNYLTDVWGLSFTNSAAIMNIYGGLCLILPVFFLFFVDLFWGHFRMLALSSISYSLGIAFIAMSTPPVLAKSTGTCKQYEPNCIGNTQRGIFYAGMVLVAVGVSGNQVSLKPFLEEQGHDPDVGFRSMNIGQLAGFSMVVVVPVVGAIALPYITPWSIRFGIPAICTVIATVLFWSGSCFYEKENSEGSPITNVLKVYVAFVANMFKRRPLNDDHYRRQGQGTFRPTRFLRCLEKAAIDVPNASRWRVCEVEEIEDAKIAIRMIPMWLTFIICGIISSIGSSYFVEQSNNMNRRIGKWNLPPQILLFFYKSMKQDIFDKQLAKFLSGASQPGKKSAFGIGIAMIFSILCAITSAKIELKRLHVINHHGLLDSPDADIPMSVYWLLFQFFLLAGLDSFFEKSIAEYYKSEAPKSTESYFEYFAKFVFGLGYMCNVLTVYIVGRVSEKGGRRNWFQHTLNRSRLDRYYWVLAGLGAVNLILFILVASFYRYQNSTASISVEAGIDGPQYDAGDGANKADANNMDGDTNDTGGKVCCC